MIRSDSPERGSAGRHSRRPWHSLSPGSDAPLNGMAALARVGADSPWFSGHFPGEPILPGIAQLAMVVEAVEAAMGRAVKPSAIRRVRFRRVIQPDEPFSILVTPREEGAPIFNFKIDVEGENACSGILVMENREEEQEKK